MPNKSLLPRFVEIIPLGVTSLIIGIISVPLSYKVPGIACLLAVIGVLFGSLTFESNADKLDKFLAVIGILISFVNVVFILIATTNALRIPI